MAEDKIHLQIVTQQGTVLDQMVHYVSIPLENGSVGILQDHQPMLAAVVDGTLRCEQNIDNDVQTYYIYVGTGVVSVDRNHIITLVRDAARSEDIDLDRAKRAAEAAEMNLKTEKDNPEEIDHLKRAMARIKTKELSSQKQE
jgi:F-type H+-transporting ATPase subunit epsilon